MYFFAKYKRYLPVAVVDAANCFMHIGDTSLPNCPYNEFATFLYAICKPYKTDQLYLSYICFCIFLVFFLYSNKYYNIFGNIPYCVYLLTYSYYCCFLIVFLYVCILSFCVLLLSVTKPFYPSDGIYNSSDISSISTT